MCSPRSGGALGPEAGAACRGSPSTVVPEGPMPRKSSRPTVATIARDLGISAATVSYALNGKPGVGPALRARIEEHAREVGWTPHSGARALRRGHSGNIGLVMVREPQERAREPFYAAVTAGIESATSARGRELLIRFVEGGLPEEIEVFRSWSHQRRVDGVVLLDMHDDDPRPPALAAMEMPFSVLGGYTGSEDFVNVLRSEADDARTVLDHLERHGYDGVIQLVGPTSFHHERRRVDLVSTLCAERGMPHAHLSGTYSIEFGTEGLAGSPLDLSSRPAVIASSDLIAVGALRAARARQVVIPEELGLVSWDDSLIAQVASPSLTALSRDAFGMGRLAGDLLLEHLDGEVPAGTVLRTGPAELVQRESTSPS